MAVVKLLVLYFEIIILLRLGNSALIIRPNDVYEGLIKSIYDYAHCKSITLIYASSLDPTTSLGLKMETKLIALNLYFSQKLYIQTMTIDIRKYPSQISKNIDGMTNPLFIILNDSDDIKLLLATRIFTPSASLSSRGTWLIFFKDVKAVEKFCGNFSIPYNSEVLITMRKVNEPRKESIIEVYQFGNKFIYKQFGSWSPDTGLIPPKLSFLQRRSNLEGLPLRVAMSKKTSHDSKTTIFGKHSIYYDFMELMADIMNFTPIIKFEEKIGLCEGNKNCSYIMDDLVNKEIDICFASMILSVKRLNYIDMTMNFHSSKLFLFVKQPEYISSWKEYFKPLGFDVWIAIWVLTMLSSVILFIIEMVYNTDDELKPWTHSKIKTLNCFNFMFKVFAIICGKKIGKSRSAPMRIIQVTLQIASLLISTAYSAQLIQSLTSGTIVKPPFSSMNEFLNDKTTRLSQSHWSRRMGDFSDFPTEQKERMEAKLLNENLPTSEIEGLSKLCHSNKRGFLSYRAILNEYNLPDDCKILTVEAVSEHQYSMGLQKNSPFREIFNYQIIRVGEKGFLRRKINKLDPKKVELQIQQKWIPVKLSHIHIVNLFNLLTKFLSLIMLFGEIMVYDKIKKTKRSRKRAKLNKSI